MSSSTFKRAKFFYIKLLAVFLLIVSVLIAFFTMKLRTIIEDNVLLSVHETALHDKRAIQAFMEFFLDELAGIQKRIVASDCKTIKEIETNLNLEGTSTNFTRIFMLAEDGRIFTDKFLIYKPGQDGIGGRFDFRNLFSGSDRQELVMRFDDNAKFAGISREAMMYALKLDDYSVGNIRMKAIIGFTNIDFLQQHMIIDGFIRNGKPYSYSSIIDTGGSYIVGRTKDIYLNNDTNFFKLLRNAKDSTLTERQIRENMLLRKEFSFYAGEGNNRKLIYFVPFVEDKTPQPDWYFIMEVDNRYLAERQATFSILGLSLLGIAMLVLLLLMFYGIRTRNKLHMADEAVRVRSEFLSSMSHEIRTPLNGIIGLNYLVSTHVDDRGRLGQVKGWLEKSKSLSNHLLSLLNDILDMSKLQAGKIEIVNEPFSLTRMLDDVVLMQSANAEKNGLVLTSGMDVPYPDILGDETRLKQILLNIIGNAIKFTPAGGSIKIDVRQELADTVHVRTIYRCADTGRGMSKAFLQKIFDPFVQDSRAKSDTTLQGTGLGMAITRELVEAMGGHIEVDSTEGEGSVFTFEIPSEILPGNAAPVAAQTPPLAPVHGRGKILLAEDADFNAEFLIELLTEQGFAVVHARDGREALGIFRESGPGEFSVILMDMQMPVMDGCEATAEIRKLPRDDAESVLIYACTANTFKEDMDKALASGMNDFLTKPINIQTLLQKMAQTIHPGFQNRAGN